MGGSVVFDQIFDVGFDHFWGGGEKTMTTVYSTTRPKENLFENKKQRELKPPHFLEGEFY